MKESFIRRYRYDNTDARAARQRETKERMRNGNFGFNALKYLSPEMIKFMHLDQLNCGTMGTMAFCTKFVIIYMKLGGLVELNRCTLNRPLLELFAEAMVREQIEPPTITYVQLQRLLKHHYVLNLLGSPDPVANQPIGAISKPRNLKAVEEFLDKIRARIGTRDVPPDVLEECKIQWLCTGLPGWKEEDVRMGEIHIIRLKVYGGDDDPECCICMDNVKTQVFLPCRHMCCCADCSQSIIRTNQPCPICRANIINQESFDQKKHDLGESNSNHDDQPVDEPPK